MIKTRSQLQSRRFTRDKRNSWLSRIAFVYFLRVSRSSELICFFFILLCAETRVDYRCCLRKNIRERENALVPSWYINYNQARAAGIRHRECRRFQPKRDETRGNSICVPTHAHQRCRLRELSHKISSHTRIFLFCSCISFFSDLILATTRLKDYTKKKRALCFVKRWSSGGCSAGESREGNFSIHELVNLTRAIQIVEKIHFLSSPFCPPVLAEMTHHALLLAGSRSHLHAKVNTNERFVSFEIKYNTNLIRRNCQAYTRPSANRRRIKLSRTESSMKRQMHNLASFLHTCSSQSSIYFLKQPEICLLRTRYTPNSPQSLRA